MGDVSYLRKNALPTNNGSLKQLVDELESIVLLQKRALDVLAWRAPNTISEITIISNTMSVLHSNLCALKDVLSAKQ
jgi:hypothetical protein